MRHRDVRRPQLLAKRHDESRRREWVVLARNPVDDHVGCAASPGDCWAMCEDEYGDGLVAIDWWDDGGCYCQHDCECMAEVARLGRWLPHPLMRRVGALPHGAGPDEDEDTSAPTMLTAVPSAVPTSTPTPAPTRMHPTIRAHAFFAMGSNPVPACCVEQQFDATGDVVGTSCYHGRSPWEESTMADLCTAGHSDAGAMAPPFRDCSQAAMDAEAAAGTPRCTTCARRCENSNFAAPSLLEDDASTFSG